LGTQGNIFQTKTKIDLVLRAHRVKIVQIMKEEKEGKEF
jgi:hypothetical protein